MKIALALEKTMNEALIKLHEVAVTNKDYEVVTDKYHFFKRKIILRAANQGEWKHSVMKVTFTSLNKMNKV